MFAERLKTLRKSKGLTQLELAKILGVSTSTIGMYEQGRREPELNFVMKIASYFQVSSDFILGFDQDKDEEEKTIEHVLNEIKELLLSQRRLIFRGETIDPGQLDRVVDAIELSAIIALNNDFRDKYGRKANKT